MKLKATLSGIIFLFSINAVIAQCTTGQTEIELKIGTDTYGYEGYWQLVPTGNNCGTGMLYEGGNTQQVGCNGGGDQDASTVYGYGDNTTVTVGPWCLDSASALDIIYVDDYGDGGFNFTVWIDGYPMYTFTGVGTGNTFSFTGSPPLEYDAGVTNISLPLYGNPGALAIE